MRCHVSGWLHDIVLYSVAISFDDIPTVLPTAYMTHDALDGIFPKSIVGCIGLRWKCLLEYTVIAIAHLSFIITRCRVLDSAARRA